MHMSILIVINLLIMKHIYDQINKVTLADFQLISMKYPFSVLYFKFYSIFSTEIYLFLMSSRTEGQMVEADSSFMKKAICEQCDNSKKDLFICKLCLAFCCELCTIMHSCDSNLGIDEEIPIFHPLPTQSDSLSSQLLNNNMNGIGALQSYQSCRKEQQINCERCLVATAIKKCSSCKMSVYCQYCFRYVHSSSKMKNHQFYQLNKSTQTLIVRAAPQFKRPNNIKPLNFKSLGIQTKRNTFDEYLLKEIIQKVQIVKTNLSIEKRQLEAQMKDSMILIKREFDQLIDQIKMKKIEIQLKVQETYKMSLQKCIQLDKKLTIEQKISNNIQIATVNNSLISFDMSLFDNKIIKCSRQVQDILQLLDFNPIKEPLQIKLSAFTDQISNIKQRISKIDLRNSFFLLQSCCNSFISLEKSQSMQSSKIQPKSHKSSLNVSSIKSIDKGLISTFSITSPRKSQFNTPKIQKDPKSPIISKYNVNQSLYLNSTAQQLIKQQKLSSLQFSTNIKKTNLKKGIENPQEKQFSQKGLMSTKISSKKLIKGNENISKFRPSFAGENIQKTKNMINQIRKEMTEFTYRFKTQKQVEQSYDTQRQSLEISSLSIETCKKKMSLA